MDKYNHCKETLKYYSNRSGYATKSIKSIIDRMCSQRHSGYEQLYEKIEFLSDREFSDKVVNIVGSEHNAYDLITMYSRMQNTIDLLAYGMCKEDVQKLLETQTDDIAVKLIVCRW